ncbi:DUF1844 domain-containing protein [Candidatus Omnitrophota bacterium]
MEEQNQGHKEKKVDESWKEKAKQEKKPDSQKPQEDSTFIPPEASFTSFVYSLSLQALISLEEIESPLSGKKEKNLPQAQFLIDTLDMLKDKTLGNLSSDEASFLDNILYELKMKFANKVEGKEKL